MSIYVRSATNFTDHSVNGLNLDKQPWPTSNFTATIGVTGSGKINLAQGSSVGVNACSLQRQWYYPGTGFYLHHRIWLWAGSGTNNQGASPFDGGGGICLDQTFGGGAPTGATEVKAALRNSRFRLT